MHIGIALSHIVQRTSCDGPVSSIILVHLYITFDSLVYILDYHHLSVSDPLAMVAHIFCIALPLLSVSWASMGVSTCRRNFPLLDHIALATAYCHGGIPLKFLALLFDIQMPYPVSIISMPMRKGIN